MELFGLTLDPFQEQAIDALHQGKNVLVCAPTGTGKTLVADWVVTEALESGGQVIYTAPIKALSNQKFRDYQRLFGEEKVGLVTGDLVIRRNAPCRVMTTEILRNMLLGGEPIPKLRAVIIDEIHFLDDRERGTTWEEVLIYLDKSVRIVGLSATISNLKDFGDWIRSVRGEDLEVVIEEKRAVPLHYLVATRKGGLMEVDAMEKHAKRVTRSSHRSSRTSKSSRHASRPRGRDDRVRVENPTRHTHVFDYLNPRYLPFLYFVFSRRNAEGCAQGLLRHIDHRSLLNPGERKKMDARLETFKTTAGSKVLTDRLLALYRCGIAYHHAGLHVQLKALVESLYEEHLIKVLYCTSTFALGINMPARAAVFDSMQRFDGKQMIWLPTREFMQMAGRAGRRGMDKDGLVVVRTDPEEFAQVGPILKRHLEGHYEPVRSSFSLSFNSVVNLVHRHPPEKIQEIVEHSFLNFWRMRQREKVVETRDGIREELLAAGWEEGGVPPPGMRTLAKQLRKLDNRLRAGTTKSLDQFNEKVEFLVRWGYLSEEGELLAGAKVLIHVQIQEIFVTEVLLGGLFEHLDAATLFGILCGMCMELPRSASAKPSRDHRGLARAITKIRHSDVVAEAEQMTHQEVIWDPAIIPVGVAWARGETLEYILGNVRAQTDISGDLVSCIRRAKDLAKQLRGVWHEEPEKLELLREIAKAVSRDEVEVVA